MFLLVGLGNPGEKYQNTSHNVGHWLVDQLEALDGFTLRKTSVYMNNSGLAVKRLLDEMKLSPDNLVVAHDDLDLKLGEFKLQEGRGSAGHKGVQSIIDTLGTQNFWRLRLGIGRPPSGFEAEEYVLGEFAPGELKIIGKLIPKIEQRIKAFLDDG